MNECLDELIGGQFPIQKACRLVGRNRASYYRWKNPPVAKPRRPRGAPANKLSDAERQQVLDVLHSDRFVDKRPAHVWAALLDDGRYLCSESTMYRILRANSEVCDRRRQATHPPRVAPHLVACKPMDVWSWDITKLPTTKRGVYYNLYVIIDLYSRYVPGWIVTHHENGELAESFIADTIKIHGRPTALHADRGSPMTSKNVTGLLDDLGIDRSHSRPRVSNDNPYSEAAFKTLKYSPEFPDRFGSIEDARAFCEQFFTYYNHEHRHSGIGLHTPASVHHGTHREIRQQRAQTLATAYATHPERFTRPPIPPALPPEVWINQPQPQNQEEILNK